MRKHALNKAVRFCFISFMINLFCCQFIAGKGFCWMKQLNLQELTDKASHVIVGKVISKKSSWNPDRTKIYTDVTISVQEQIKGSLKERDIVVRYLGGEIPEEDIGMKVLEMPEFKMDEEAVLFIKPDEMDTTYKVVGGCQGKYTVKDRVVLKRHLPLSDFRNQVMRIIDKHKLEDQQ